MPSIIIEFLRKLIKKNVLNLILLKCQAQALSQCIGLMKSSLLFKRAVPYS